MKRVFLLFTMLVAAGCASEQGAPARQDQEFVPGVDAYTLDLLDEKLRANGAALLCDQEGYVACYGLTTQACMAELAPRAEPCFAKTENKYGPLTWTNNEPFGGYFVTCMLFEHVSMHAENAAEIMGCMNNADFNQKKSINSLMK